MGDILRPARVGRLLWASHRLWKLNWKVTSALRDYTPEHHRGCLARVQIRITVQRTCS